MSEPRWFVGLDWASEDHRARLLDCNGNLVGEYTIKHDGAALAEFCTMMLQVTGAAAAEIAVAIETTRGPVVEILLERGFQTFSINPKQLDRFRDRFTAAGAKDDGRDADVLGRSLRTDRQAFRRLSVDDPLIIQLREWSRLLEELTRERTRLSNRMRQQLWRYYPQAQELTDDVADTWFLDLWERLPTPAEAARVREKTVARILSNRRIRRIDAVQVLAVLRRPPLTVAPGTVEAATAHIRTIVARLRLVNDQMKEAEQRIDQLCDQIEAAADATPGQICEQRDMAILRSWPGLGRINIATLLAEASEPLRRRDYQVLRTLSGQAPVTRSSGKTRFVVRRLACNNRLRTALYHWARAATQHDPAARKHYDELRARGLGKARAYRSIGDGLLFRLCKALERQTPFDPDYKANRAKAREQAQA